MQDLSESLSWVQSLDLIFTSQKRVDNTLPCSTNEIFYNNDDDDDDDNNNNNNELLYYIYKFVLFKAAYLHT